MNLDFDLGTMQLDESFRWVDPGQIDVGIADFAASMMGLNVTNVGFPTVNHSQENESLDDPSSLTDEAPQPPFEEEPPAVELLEPKLSPPLS